MKTNYLHRANRSAIMHGGTKSTVGSRRPRSRMFRFFSWIIVIFALIGLFYVLKNPIASGFYGIRSLFVSDAPVGTIELAPNVLNAQLSALELENAQLRALVGKRTESDDAAAAAAREVVTGVLMRPPQMPYDLIVVKSGANEGIEVGDKAYAAIGFPIGDVVEVKPTTSVIRLFSAPGTKTEVLIGTSTTAVVAEGKGGGNFFLKLPKVTEIKEGDIVTRTYLSPETFSVIESVDSTQGEAYTYAYFKLPVNIHNLVYVIVKKDTH